MMRHPVRLIRTIAMIHFKLDKAEKRFLGFFMQDLIIRLFGYLPMPS